MGQISPVTGARGSENAEHPFGTLTRMNPHVSCEITCFTLHENISYIGTL